MQTVAATQKQSWSARFHAWLAGTPEDAVLRFIFRVIVAGVIFALGFDLASSNGWITERQPALEAEPAAPATGPSLPSILAPFLPGQNPAVVPAMPADGKLGKPMTFNLVGNNRLMAVGTITPGSADAFAAEVAARSDYIKTVVLSSPGGSVTDALAMGRLIREKKFATEVEAGKYCASSCPLVFVGGVERRAAEKAAIGVHQVFAMASADNVAARNDMSDAQRISATVQRYLGDMGINLQMWVRAMETPKDKLYLFKPEELKTLGIVTAAKVEPSAPTPPAVSPPSNPPAPAKSR